MTNSRTLCCLKYCVMHAMTTSLYPYNNTYESLALFAFQKQWLSKSYSDFFNIPALRQDHLPWILHNETSVCKHRARAARPWPNVKNCITATWWRNHVEQFTDAISWWQRFVCVLSVYGQSWWQIPLRANIVSALLPYLSTRFYPVADLEGGGHIGHDPPQVFFGNFFL